MHVPMLLGERVLGVMSAQSYEPNVYSEEDLQMFQMMAGQTAVAVENFHQSPSGTVALLQSSSRGGMSG